MPRHLDLSRLAGALIATGAAFGQTQLLTVHSDGIGPSTLYRVDVTTGARTPWGTLGYTVNGLARGPAGSFWADDTDNSALVSIDPVTGATLARLGPYGGGHATMEGLAWDPASGWFFGYAFPTRQFVRIDPVTGAATSLGTSTGLAIAGLSFDPTGTWLYAADFDSGRIFRVDPVTLVSTMIATANPGQAGGPLGLAHDPVAARLYVSEWWGGASGAISSVDLNTGQVSPVASWQGFWQLEGLTEMTGLVGANFCGPLFANSTGAVGALRGEGSAILATNSLRLRASGLPASSLGYFLTSRTQAYIPQPGGSAGVLCLGSGIGRFIGPGQVQSSGPAGVIALDLDLASLPTPIGPVAATAGQTWNFQLWHRDTVAGVATSNFSQGLTITWQ